MISPKKELVSIIVPVCNAERYLGACIKSILDQSYRNLEVIIVLNGCNDNSKSICREFAASDARVIEITSKVVGASAARNTGIKKARGDYLIFVDSDDYIEAHCIDTLLKMMKADKKCSIAVGGYSCVEEMGGSKKFAKKRYSEIVDNRQLMRLFLDEDVTSPTVWGKLYKRELLDGIGFDVSVSIGEDKDLLFRLLKNDCTAAIDTSVSLYNYRIRGDSATNLSAFNKGFLAEISLAEEIMDYYRGTSVFRSAQRNYILSNYKCMVRLLRSGKYENNVDLFRKEKKSIRTIPFFRRAGVLSFMEFARVEAVLLLGKRVRALLR